VTGAPGTASKLADGLKSYGAAKIYVAESDAVDKYLGGVQVAVLESLIASASPAAVLIAASADGKEIAGRLAVRTDSGLLTDVVGVDGDGSAQHSIFGGAFVVTAKANTAHPVDHRPARRGGVRAGRRRRRGGDRRGAGVVQPAGHRGRPGADRGWRPPGAHRGVDRGVRWPCVGSADNFSVIEALADSLGAAVGASRAAVDSGYYPNQFQVGRPARRYLRSCTFALGISGAIQHRPACRPRRRSSR